MSGDVIAEEILKLAPVLGLNRELLLQLRNMVMNDKQPSFTQGIYLFSEYIDNELSSFIAAQELIERDASAEVFIIYGGGHGSPGYSHWVERLGRYIPKGRIRQVPIEKPWEINTYSESVALVNFAIKENRKSWYIVAPPFHMLRAFMTTVSVSIKHGSKINFYAHPGAPQDWNEFVTHSQGIKKGKRRFLVGEELKSIKIYSGLGHIESIQNILNYVQQRK